MVERHNEGKDIPTIRTFESDATDYVKEEGVSRARVALAKSETPIDQNKKFKFEEKTIDKERAKNFIYIGSLFLISGILIILAFVYIKPLQAPTPPLSGGRPIVIVDDEEKINITNIEKNKAYEMVINKLRLSTVGVNSLLNLRIEKNVGENTTPISTKEFLQLGSFFNPDRLERSLENGFALGLLGNNGSQPFLIFKVDSFDTAFADMQQWERTMPNDLRDIFEKENGWVDTGPAYGPGSPISSIFNDEVVDNIDTRVLKNSSGLTLMMYAFADSKTIIITSNESAFSNLVSKLRNAKLLR